MANLLQLKNGGKNFGARELFAKASFAINAEERVGVIGPNGAGKSTLFRILVGQETLDEGDITRATGLKVGYLAQEDDWGENTTVEEVLTRQTATPIWELKRLAPLFGLEPALFPNKMSTLSRGFCMRVKLLHLLASQPDLMLLDEPTNYLDLESLLVLENFLLSSPCAFLLISHDREFLRRCTDHILEIEAGQMTKFAGNIDDYFEQKELLRTQLEKAAMTAQAKRAEVLDFAARFGAKATKARQVQSRLKQLDKMEAIEVRSLPLTARIRLPEPPKAARSVVRVENGELGYGTKKVLTGVHVELGKGDHLGVVGVNGAGKSTLLKALAGDLAPLSGSVAFGQGIEVAYFAQAVAESLKPEDTVFEAIAEHAGADVSQQEILDLAASLLFSGDDTKKKVRVLSGGEKSRVALGQILLKRANLLLLDEPTNHLDFHTVEALTQALADYPGAFVVVSHDRGFVRRTASKILEISNGKAEFYPGTYEEYVWSVQKGAMALRKSEDTGLSGLSAKDTMGEGDAAPPGSAVKFNFKDKKKQLEKDMRGNEKEMQKLDQDIQTMKSRLIEINEALTTVMGAQAAELARDLAKTQAAIDAAENRYIDCLSSHEEAEREIALIEKRRTE
jgi:ATP-binding cassette subfamily F protein 3